MKLRYATLVLMLNLSISTLSHAEQTPHERECRAIQERITQLNQKRRAGGNNKQMGQWKRQRHQLSDRAYKLKCHKFGISR